jgi:hypothetical protein
MRFAAATLLCLIAVDSQADMSSLTINCVPIVDFHLIVGGDCVSPLAIQCIPVFDFHLTGEPAVDPVAESIPDSKNEPNPELESSGHLVSE